MEDSRRILCGCCSLQSLKDSPLRRPAGIAQTPGGVLCASGTAVVITSSAEPQMQRTSMFFLKLFGLL